MPLFRRDQKENKEIDVGAFADIAFLLIIFFILTTTFDKPFGDSMDIPAGKEGKESEDEVPTVNLTKEGILWGKDQENISLEQLRTRLVSMNLQEKHPDERTVILDCAPEVIYNQYYAVVMAVTKAGGVVALMEYQDGGESP